MDLSPLFYPPGSKPPGARYDDDRHPQECHDPRQALAGFDSVAGLPERIGSPFCICLFVRDLDVKGRHTVRCIVQLSAPRYQKSEQQESD